MAKKTQGKAVAKATKKAVTKTAAAKRSPSRGARAGKPVDGDQRRLMIAEAAYYIAEQRGFCGDAVQDWLLAEAQIDDRLAPRK
jgi:hypothetical protein